MQTPDEDNIIFKTAADFINNSNHPVFLTGKAGTGKTTFLKYIRNNTRKNAVVLAPTGVAAINARGTTIHSFFQLPFGPYLPENKTNQSQQGTVNKHDLLSNLKLPSQRKEIMELLELLIIDEISMVRCDVLDAIDTVLRHVRRKYSKPFGGVQVLYIGDMYQLPPVIKDDEWKILGTVYNNPYFFSSRVVIEQYPVYIELKKVYRQKDNTFIHLLNQVRNNEMDEAGYQLLHERYLPDFKVPSDENFITLTTHNSKADTINDEALRKILTPGSSFSANVSGSFFENSFPADETFNVKPGAQVMFLKNDVEKVKRYYNGKIGLVKKIENDKIWVECNTDDHLQLIEVKKETWRNIKYSLNHKTHQIEEEELGSFTQFPLRLAWAITIHKSQGLTFNNAIIDAGNAFAPGQVYVALSRCTSLEGIVLRSKISYSSLKSDQRIVDFASGQQSNMVQEQILFNATKEYQQEIILGLFDHKIIAILIKDLLFWVKENNSLGKELPGWLSTIKTQVDVFTGHGEKFIPILNESFLQPVLPSENEAFQQRFRKAVSWFFTEIEKTKKELLKSPAVTDNRQLANDYNSRLQKIVDLLSASSHLLYNMLPGFDLSAYYKHREEYIKEIFPVNAFSGKANYISQDILYPDLYNDLKDKRNEIAIGKDIPIYMVCKTISLQEMVNYLPCSLQELGMISGFGSVKLKQFGNDFINIIKDYCELHDLVSIKPAIETRKSKKPKPKGILKPDSKLASFKLYQTGKTVAEIAEERNLSVATIEGHLAHFIEMGEINIDELIEKSRQQKIAEKLNLAEYKTLQSLKEQAPFASYAELKWMIASQKSKTIRVDVNV